MKLAMRLNPLTWRFRSLAYVFLGILLFYVGFIYKKVHQVDVEFTIKNTKPAHVWEFVADFNNIMKLNPTIEEFNIIDESGNYDHWKYSVYYTEHLSHFPSIQNTAYGYYSVRADVDDFVISSQHNTCFYGSISCVKSTSEFRFTSVKSDTKCVEHVEYECPIAFAILCYKEVMYQRNEISRGLNRHFSTINSQTDDN